ncbi:MAG: aminopeptidase P family protein [Anaerolineaceae bacterium]|nr:aminopeptidase P family protein [Anaerolineaceae bacterium]
MIERIPESNEIVTEKVNQAVGLLKEMDIDIWLLVTSEDGDARDPVYTMLFGDQDMSRGLLLLTKNDDRIVIVGQLDAVIPEETGVWDQVIGINNESEMQQALLDTLSRINPHKIALNYSERNPKADGLTYGMFRWLTGTLAGTPYMQRMVSGELLASKLRSKKTPGEVACIKYAVEKTENVFESIRPQIKVGLTGKEIHRMMLDEVDRRGYKTAWSRPICPVVTVGPVESIGHTPPTDIPLEPGWLLHIDFGVKVNGFCGDIQRMFYALNEGEKEPPVEVQALFSTVRKGVDTIAANLIPGNPVWLPLEAAKDVMVAGGYASPKFSAGHHLGRAVHDGAPSLRRYPDSFPGITIEAGNVFTAEGMENLIEGYGWISLEDDVLVTHQGGKILNTRQEELWLIH